jgi:cyanophycinase
VVNIKPVNRPKGKLIAIGGNEAKNQQENEEREENIDFKKGVLEEVLKELKGPDSKIVVLPLASKQQEDMEKRYREAFEKLGKNIEVLIIESKHEVDKKDNLKKIENADAIFITGGDQARLKEMLENSIFLELLKKKYQQEDFLIAGTSAGSMVLSEYMIDSGMSEESLLKGLIKLTKGFDFLPETVIDTHFLKRGRFSRLTEALLQERSIIGIGICEDTALVITDGNELRAIGSGTVTIIDNSEIKNTNYNQIKEKDPVYLENLRVHVLAKGAAYSLDKKEFHVIK